MRRVRMAFFIVVLCCAASCQTTGPESLKDPYSPAFYHHKITLQADADRAVTDRVITITGTCTPLVRGKGRLQLRAWPHDPADYVMLESPTHDTLYRIGDSDTANLLSYIAVDLVPNTPVSGQWSFRLPANARNGDYSFSANAFLDSVFIADSGKVLPYNSEAVRRTTESGAGYHRGASSLDLLVLTR